MQQGFVTLLNTQLADMGRAEVVLFQAVFLDALFIPLIDAADVAHHMHRQIAVRILAKAALGHAHTFELELLHRKARHFFFGQFGTNRYAVIGIIFGAKAVKTFNIRIRHRNNLLDFSNRLLQIFLIFRNDFQRKTRIVTRQHELVAIHNPAARRLDRNLCGTVRLGLLTQFVILEYLQIHKARHQNTKAQQHQNLRHPNPLAENLALSQAGT